MSEVVIQGVIETVDCAIQYRALLSNLIDGVHDAKNQVETTSSLARSKLELHFTDLKSCINEALDERLRLLQRAISDAEQTALKPLNQCEDLLMQRLATTVGILDEGKGLLQSVESADDNNCAYLEFKEKIRTVDLNSLPEVPSIWETDSIHIDLPRDEDNIQKQLVDAIKDYGRLITRPPVQITDYSERPAALLIKWAEIPASEDQSLDVEEFRLQSCEGRYKSHDLESASRFVDVYHGPSTSHVIRNVAPNKPYSFRVCGRSTGARSWTPWSVPVVCTTPWPHHEWRSGSTGYTLSEENTCIGVSGDVGSSSPAIFSKARSYTCGHSLAFRVNQVGDLHSENAVGLAVTDLNSSNLHQKGILFYSFNGGVFVDGQEKTTRLPAVHAGSVVQFETEVLQPDKVRVTVEVNEKIVTFDWSLDMQCVPSEGVVVDVNGDSKMKLYFVGKLTSPEWSLTVE